jgi:hypothetical protein
VGSGTDEEDEREDASGGAHGMRATNGNGKALEGVATDEGARCMHG